MARGWITKEEYLRHHDPQLWKAHESLPGDAAKEDRVITRTLEAS
jgi:hypothetical protein